MMIKTYYCSILVGMHIHVHCNSQTQFGQILLVGRHPSSHIRPFALSVSIIHAICLFFPRAECHDMGWYVVHHVSQKWLNHFEPWHLPLFSDVFFPETSVVSGWYNVFIITVVDIHLPSTICSSDVYELRIAKIHVYVFMFIYNIYIYIQIDHHNIFKKDGMTLCSVFFRI